MYENKQPSLKCYITYLSIIILLSLCNGISSMSSKTDNQKSSSINTNSSVLKFMRSWLGPLAEPPIGFPKNYGQDDITKLSKKVKEDYEIGLKNEDVEMNITQLAAKYKNPMESHKVITKDGYILTLFRIPSEGSPVVFLMHGLMGSADDFIISGPERALAYLLADEGYDVWIGNSRGNKHSRRHTKFNSSKSEFWDFSWHEIGIYDVPSSIDYVLDITQQKSLKYVGVSQGTTAFFVMTSEMPEYNDKVSFMIALAPVAFFGNTKSPIPRILSPLTNVMYELGKTVGIYEAPSKNLFISALRPIMCDRHPIFDLFCNNLVFLMTGVNFEQLNASIVPVLLSHDGLGASTKQMTHYGQGILSHNFRKFDYGPDKNLRTYGTKEPPEYDLKNIKTPISLFYSSEDWLANEKDVKTLYNKLNSVVDLYKIPFEPFNHVDFVFAKDFRKLIFERVHMLLRQSLGIQLKTT